MITSNARCTREINSRTVMTNMAFSKKKALFTSKWDLGKKLIKFCLLRTALHGAKPWALRKVDQTYLEYFEMWCWRRMEIIWTDIVKNELVLHRIKRKGISQIQHKVEV
jgi:hypothetical protein